MKELSNHLYVCYDIPNPSQVGALIGLNGQVKVTLYRLDRLPDGNYMFAKDVAPVELELKQLSLQREEWEEELPLSVDGKVNGEQNKIDDVCIDEAHASLMCNDVGVGVVWCIHQHRQEESSLGMSFEWPFYDDDDELSGSRTAFLWAIRNPPEWVKNPPTKA